MITTCWGKSTNAGLGENTSPNTIGADGLGLGINNSPRGSYPAPPQQQMPGLGENTSPDTIGADGLGLGINNSPRGSYPAPPQQQMPGLGENTSPDTIGADGLGLGINNSQRGSYPVPQYEPQQTPPDGADPGANAGWWDKMKGNPTAMWTAGAALNGLLQHLGRAREQKRKDKIAAVAARWSPVTGDKSWQKQAYATRPNLANALTQGALSGYMTGESIRKGQKQEDQADEDREARRKLFAANHEDRKGNIY